VALLGGGWAANVAAQLRRGGFEGDVWPVHPTRAEVGGYPALRSLADLPRAPDAAFVGVNREATVEVVRNLATMGAGGAVCFAAGFAEVGEGALQDRLAAAAGPMPILGPNCYGLLNYLDNVALWPDQHGGVAVERGVAIVGQSSNVAINLTMQRRGLPLAYVLMAGNQAQTGLADLARAALDDPRVTAVGLHVEGFGNLRAWEVMAAHAARLGKPIVVLKAGRSEAARAATLSHTASLAGGAAVASAFLRRTGCVEVRSLGAFLEALKLLHHGGPLGGDAVASVSCSGGEASLVADAADGSAVRWAPLPVATAASLRASLGPLVAVANPLDYHTFIWGDAARMTDTFAAVLGGGFDLTLFVLDLPRADRCDPSGYACAVEAVLAAAARTGARAAVLASLPEGMDEAATARFEAGGVAVLHGLADGLAAVDAAIRAGRARPDALPALVRPAAGQGAMLSEAEAKAALAAYGLPVPRAVTAPDAAGDRRGGGRAALSPRPQGARRRAQDGGRRGRARPRRRGRNARGGDAHGPPRHGAPRRGDGARWRRGPRGRHARRHRSRGPHARCRGRPGRAPPRRRHPRPARLARGHPRGALSLRLRALLEGWRGAPAADLHALLDAVGAVAAYAQATPALVELDVNPLIAGPHGAVAVDALIRLETP
jgi:acyl-CoA synthetase (NDP forming)